MTGFELSLNGIVKKASIDHGVISITITRVKDSNRNEMGLTFSGMDKDRNQSLVWLSEGLKLNDTITIAITDVEMNSEPQKVKQLDLENEILEGKLRAYRALKIELEAKGLI